MKIGIGCDHAGLELKLELISLLKDMGFDCVDYGTDVPKSVDYPDFGEKVSSAVSSGGMDRGILICGTGIGMSIVANKFPGIRASLCNDLFTAKDEQAAQRCECSGDRGQDRGERPCKRDSTGVVHHTF